MTRPYRREAKALEISVKWWSTGKVWVEKLSTPDKVKFAVDLRKAFSSGGPDPDDSINQLDKLAMAIWQTGKGELEGSNTGQSWGVRGSSGQAMLAGWGEDVDKAYPWSNPHPFFPDPVSEVAFSADAPQTAAMVERMADDLTSDPSIAEAFAAAGSIGKGRGYPSRNHIRNVLDSSMRRGMQGGKGASYNKFDSKGGRGRYTAPPQNSGQFQGKGGKGSKAGKPADQWFDTRSKVCFAQGCKQPRHQHHTLCVACHRHSIANGGIMCKDGKRVMAGTSRAYHAEERSRAEAFWAEHGDWAEGPKQQGNAFLQYPAYPSASSQPPAARC